VSTTLLLAFGLAVAGALALAVYAIRVMMGDRPKLQKMWTPPGEAAGPVPPTPSSGIPQRPSRRMTPSGRVALPGLPPSASPHGPPPHGSPPHVPPPHVPPPHAPPPHGPPPHGPRPVPSRMARGSTPPPLATVPAHAPAVQPRRAPTANDHEPTRIHDQRRVNLKKVYR
jgi:hypothetical protein